jgi:alpha-tubulin suppressor-like RCC1 family protein
MSNSTVYAWGEGGHGQLGVHSNNDKNTAVQVHGPGNVDHLSGVQAIAAGNNHSLALMEDGTLYAWGSNDYGQLGIGNKDDHTVPYQVHGPGNVDYLSGITAVAAGEHHSMALRNDGTVWAWGGNGHGQLGIGNEDNHTVPYPVHGPGNVGYLSGVTDVEAGKFFSLALGNGGTVWAWGENYNGQLGIGNRDDHTVPYQVHGVGNQGYLTGIGPAVASSKPPVEPVDGKYPICRKSGTPKEHTRYVPESALKGHLLHGVTLGECP